MSRIDRSFPLRVAPIQGEALDSWLDAIAHRHHVPRRAVIERCAIAPISFYGAWIRLLTPADIDGIAQATGYGRDLVEVLVLPRSGSGVGPLSGARTLPSSAWDWRASSRWCPQCLTDTGGRWLLAWRLNWTFACPIHDCLLQDGCPDCGAPQRCRAPAFVIPELGRCARPIRDLLGQRRRCGAGLTRVPQGVHPLSSSMMRTQRLINALLAGRPSRLRVYGTHQPTPHDMLTDVKTLARYVFTLLGGAADLTVPADTAGAASPDRSSPGRTTARPTMLSAVHTAKASTLAAAVLDAHDPTAAQHLLAKVILADGKFESHRVYHDEALTPLARLICQRASEYARVTLKLRRRFDTTATKSTQSLKMNRLARAAARIDSMSYHSGTRWSR
ncbi:TniQ family protein [Mycolicibacterium sp. jd]|uniref:TniQ family protein n=1 Tax=unclassified Mycolicibacterium TaxID=2636767 RepID=UPI00351BDCE8